MSNDNDNATTTAQMIDVPFCTSPGRTSVASVDSEGAGTTSPLSTCYEIDPLADPRWADLVERDPRASVFHSTNWLRALRDVYGYEPLVATTCPPHARLTNGLVFCRIRSWVTGRRLVSLPFSDHCEPLGGSANDVQTILAHMKEDVRRTKMSYLEIRPAVYAPNSRVGLSEGTRYVLHRLDLQPSETELFRNFHKSCVQRKIRRAERENLRYEEGTSEALLQKFFRLLVMTRRRQNLPPQPLNWFRGLIASFGKALQIRVASKDAQPIASILTLSHKKIMTYKYGCSNSAFNNLGGTALLFWTTIQGAKAQGFDEFDLGRSAVSSVGLTTFKEHWGANSQEIQYWNYPQQPGGLSSAWEQRLARHVVSNVPDYALKMIGKLMYRHIG
jgi:CelD/BcsL family acetyltransferase involved in cellulose biosynthesis